MIDEEQAMKKAWQAYADADERYSGGVQDACRAYHKAMISLTPGVKFHETDGTVRPVTWKDL